jgi:GNAT superfamily N-acetyltransferase
LDEVLLSRVEDAGLNASAPPQQRWLDGWLVRFSPGKAKRARCINAVALGRLPVAHKLVLAAEVFRDVGLPMMVRLTRFSQPPTLEQELVARGYTLLDDTRVMVCADLRLPASPPPLPAGTHWSRLDAATYAEEVGTLRESPAAQRKAHAERLESSPVRCHGFAIRRDDDQTVLACGQFARESELVGLYDVFTRDSARGQGLATNICQRLLSLAINEGAKVGYLQVEAENTAARQLYSRLGFADGYEYHYRQAPRSEP